MKNISYLLMLVLFVLSCSKENTQEDQLLNVDQFAEEVTNEFILDTRSGGDGCFEVVFPIQIEFPGGIVFDAESFLAAKEAIRKWRHEHPTADSRPYMVFPIELINEEGEIIYAQNKEELFKAVKHCRMTDQVTDQHHQQCFKIIFPIQVELPNGDILDADSPQQVREIMKKWRENHPDADRRPVIVFPIKVAVKWQDGLLEINSREELKKLRKKCRG